VERRLFELTSAVRLEAFDEDSFADDMERASRGTESAILLVQDKERGTPFASELEVGMVCRGHCFANGLVMRAVGDRMIIAPPLVITRAQIDELVGLARKCLDLTLADLRTRGLV